MSAARPRSRPSIELPVWALRTLGGVALALALALPFLASLIGWLRLVSGNFVQANVDEALRPGSILLPKGFVERPRVVPVAAFSMCATEVSLRQYELVTGSRPNDCTHGCADDHPVVGISWEDAARYLNALTRLENIAREQLDKRALSLCYDEQTWAWDQTCTGYRLPTEAEWEYAARAGSQTDHAFGDAAESTCKHGNIAGAGVCDDSFDTLVPVKTLAANAWGLHGMSGNAREWVFVGPDAARSANPDAAEPSEPAAGFRCARSVVPSSPVFTPLAVCEHVIAILSAELGNEPTAKKPTGADLTKFLYNCTVEVEEEISKVGGDRMQQQIECVMAASSVERLVVCDKAFGDEESNTR